MPGEKVRRLKTKKNYKPELDPCGKIVQKKFRQ